MQEYNQQINKNRLKIILFDALIFTSEASERASRRGESVVHEKHHIFKLKTCAKHTLTNHPTMTQNEVTFFKLF